MSVKGEPESVAEKTSKNFQKQKITSPNKYLIMIKRVYFEGNDCHKNVFSKIEILLYA